MSHEVRFTATARRDLNRIPPRIVPAIVEFAFGELARNPRRVGKPLRGEFAGKHSARRGPYRLLYHIEDEEAIVHVLRIDHRSDTYRSSTNS